MHIYANLLGNWTDITETATVADYQDPVTYFKENLTFSNNSKIADCFEYGYVNVQYQGKNYRLTPEHFQFVNE